MPQHPVETRAGNEVLGALTQRLRQMRRIAIASTRRRAHGETGSLCLDWWDGHPNVGDDLTPWLLPTTAARVPGALDAPGRFPHHLLRMLAGRA